MDILELAKRKAEEAELYEVKTGALGVSSTVARWRKSPPKRSWAALYG